MTFVISKKRKRKREVGLTLLLGKVDGILLGSKRESGSLDIVRPASPSTAALRYMEKARLRARPTHQRVLPTPTTRQDVPVKAPTIPFRPAALHGVTGRLVYTHDTMAELGYRLFAMSQTLLFLSGGEGTVVRTWCSADDIRAQYILLWDGCDL
jgi:hypothetical protein